MKKRNPFVVLLLSVVTFGIYGIYWLYATRKELLPRLQDQKAIWPVWYLFAPFLLLIVGLVIMFAVNGMGDTAKSSANVAFFLLGTVAIISLIVIPIMWMYKFSFAVASVAKGMEGMTLFLLGLLFSFLGVGIVWPILVQIDLNKFIDNQSPANPAPSAPTPPSAPLPPVSNPPTFQ
jgi:hypothetical protein